MKAKTYNDWLAIGYHVIRGEKATGRDKVTGKPTFTRDQVEEREFGFDGGPASVQNDGGEE